MDQKSLSHSNTTNLKQDLLKFFSLPQFRSGQLEIIKHLIEKRDVLAILPTGAGKSLCFQFVAPHVQKMVLVISPLIALMKDQVHGLRERGIPSACLYRGQDPLEKRMIFSEIRHQGPFVLYLSPERVQKTGFAPWLLKQNLALIAIDEAHCITQWGHDFREEYLQLQIFKELRPDVPILALTATATPQVLDDISQFLNLKEPIRMIRGFYRPNLYFQTQECYSEEEKLHCIKSALKQFSDGRVLIYCGTRKATEALALELAPSFPQIGYYHAGMQLSERTRIQKEYLERKLRILIATNAFGMGIDQPDVRLVIHFNITADIDSLYQQMGRAGRDQKPSTCLVLYSRRDKALQSYFINTSEASRLIKNKRWRALDAIVEYAESFICRHRFILEYFEDPQILTHCGHCDVCDPNSERKVPIQLSLPLK